MAQLIAPKSAPAKDKKSVEGPTLEIVSGLHNGVTLPLEQGAYRIGSNAEADIVLRDAGVAKEHGVLRVERSGLRIEAVGGDIAIEGRELLTSGRGCRMSLPLEVSFGKARLRVSDPRHTAGRRGVPLAKTLVVVGGLGACVFAASVVAGALPGSLMEGLQKASVVDAPRSKPTPDATGLVAKTPEPQPASAVDELSSRLESAGLRTLKLLPASDRITVAGTIAREQTEAWSGIQQWFDKAHSGKLMLVSNVVVGEAKVMPTLTLQAIWFGDRPYMITADGAKYYEGAFLDNGWTVKKIEEDRVTLVKGNESFALTY